MSRKCQAKRCAKTCLDTELWCSIKSHGKTIGQGKDNSAEVHTCSSVALLSTAGLSLVKTMSRVFRSSVGV